MYVLLTRSSNERVSRYLSRLVKWMGWIGEQLKYVKEAISYWWDCQALQLWRKRWVFSDLFSVLLTNTKSSLISPSPIISPPSSIDWPTRIVIRIGLGIWASTDAKYSFSPVMQFRNNLWFTICQIVLLAHILIRIKQVQFIGLIKSDQLVIAQHVTDL